MPIGCFAERLVMKDIIKPVAPDLDASPKKNRFLWFAALYLASLCVFSLVVYGLRAALL